MNQILFFLSFILICLIFPELYILKKIIKINGKAKRKELNLILIIALTSIILILKLINFNILWIIPIVFNLIYFSLILIKENKKLNDYIKLRNLISFYLFLTLLLNIFVNY